MALRRGAVAKRPAILEARPLVPDDLRALTQARPRTPIAQLRDSHHLVARLMAAGLPDDEVADRSGYSLGSVYRLRADPAFSELVAQYRKHIEAGFEDTLDEFGRLLLSNRMKAERQLADRLDDDEATLSTRDLITISRDAADRTGHGKRTTNVNVNVGMASAIEQAWVRSGRAPPMLEAKPVSRASPPLAPSQAPPRAVINRRGL